MIEWQNISKRVADVCSAPTLVAWLSPQVEVRFICCSILPPTAAALLKLTVEKLTVLSPLLPNHLLTSCSNVFIFHSNLSVR